MIGRWLPGQFAMSLIECVLPATGAATIGSTAIGLSVLFGYHVGWVYNHIADRLASYKSKVSDLFLIIC